MTNSWPREAFLVVRFSLSELKKTAQTTHPVTLQVPAHSALGQAGLILCQKGAEISLYPFSNFKVFAGRQTNCQNHAHELFHPEDIATYRDVSEQKFSDAVLSDPLPGEDCSLLQNLGGPMTEEGVSFQYRYFKLPQIDAQGKLDIPATAQAREAYAQKCGAFMGTLIKRFWSNPTLRL